MVKERVQGKSVWHKIYRANLGNSDKISFAHQKNCLRLH